MPINSLRFPTADMFRGWVESPHEIQQQHLDTTRVDAASPPFHFSLTPRWLMNMLALCRSIPL